MSSHWKKILSHLISVSRPNKTLYHIAPGYQLSSRLKDRYRAEGIDSRFAEVLEHVRPGIDFCGHLNQLSASLLREAGIRGTPIVYTL